MKSIYTILSFVLFTCSLMAQDKVIDLWPDGPPTDNGLSGPEIDEGNGRISNISTAKLYVYSPDSEINTGAALIMLTGGSYRREAMSHEGYEIAEWLKNKGITGIVLKYRLPNGHPQIPLEDASRAIRYTRQHAKEWGINPNKIGIGGASAGGHPASNAGTLFDLGKANAQDSTDTYSSRPDFILLLYPLINIPLYWPKEFVERFYGKNIDSTIVKKYSSNLNVSAKTPPVFLVLADNDSYDVLPNQAIEFYQMLRKFKISAELHVFNKGGHGFGITKHGLPVDQWPELFYDWLKAIKMVE